MMEIYNELDSKQLVYECDNFLSEMGVKLNLKSIQSYKLLHCFISVYPKILTTNELQDLLGCSKNSIRLRIFKLRKKIKPIKILSIRSIGYRLYYRR